MNGNKFKRKGNDLIRNYSLKIQFADEKEEERNLRKKEIEEEGSRKIIFASLAVYEKMKDKKSNRRVKAASKNKQGEEGGKEMKQTTVVYEEQID